MYYVLLSYLSNKSSYVSLPLVRGWSFVLLLGRNRHHRLTHIEHHRGVPEAILWRAIAGHWRNKREGGLVERSCRKRRLAYVCLVHEVQAVVPARLWLILHYLVVQPRLYVFKKICGE